MQKKGKVVARNKYGATFIIIGLNVISKSSLPF